MSGACGGMLFLLLDRLGIPRRIAIPLGILIAVSPPLLVASLRQGRNPDPLTLLVMVTGAYFIADRKPVGLGITMFVGAFNREAAMFLGPVRVRGTGPTGSGTPRRCAGPPPPRRPRSSRSSRCA